MNSFDLVCEQGGAALGAGDCDCVGCAVARAQVPRYASGRGRSTASGVSTWAPVSETATQLLSGGDQTACACAGESDRSSWARVAEYCGCAECSAHREAMVIVDAARRREQRPGAKIGGPAEFMDADGTITVMTSDYAISPRVPNAPRVEKTIVRVPPSVQGVARLAKNPRRFGAALSASAGPLKALGSSPVTPNCANAVSTTIPLQSSVFRGALNSECEGLPITVSSRDVALLRNVCSIDLDLCPLMNGIPGRDVNWNNPLAVPEGRLLASLPIDFEPTSDHSEFLNAVLPRWWSKISSFDEDLWDIADAVYMESALPRDGWLNRGLYWQQSDGFLRRAIRYAIVTLYGWAFTCESIGLFQTAGQIDKDWIRSEMRNNWRVDIGPLCDYSKDLIRIEGQGGVAVRRTWQGGFIGMTPLGATTLNDGVHLNAALADYYFWWAHRLFDYIREGRSTNELADGYVMVCCARAALAEIAEISALLMHEISHWSAHPYTLAECAGVDLFSNGRLECCHFMMGWFHGFRVAADCGLPLAMFPDLGEDARYANAQVVDYYSRGSDVFPTDSSGLVKRRFDFEFDDRWQYTATFTAVYDCGNMPSRPGGSFMKAVHTNLWDYDHPLTVSWDYPSECSGHSSTAKSKSFN